MSAHRPSDFAEMVPHFLMVCGSEGLMKNEMNSVDFKNKFNQTLIKILYEKNGFFRKIF